MIRKLESAEERAQVDTNSQSLRPHLLISLEKK